MVELLVAFGVFVLTTTLIYRFLIGGTKTATTGIWRNTTQKQLMVASDRIRKALQSASRPSVLLPEFNIVDKREEHFAVMAKGVEAGLSLGRGLDGAAAGEDAGGTFQSLGPGPVDGQPGAGSDPIFVLSATNCSPGHRRMQGLPNPDKPGTFSRFRMWLANRREVPKGSDFEEVMDLMYSLETGTFGESADAGSGTDIDIPGDPAAIAGQAKILVEAVNLVQLRLTDKDQKESTDQVALEDKPSLEIGIRCVEPFQGKAVLAKFLTIPMSVGVRTVN